MPFKADPFPLGGYAHVYLTHSETPLGPNKLTTHCLKRLAFQDEQAPDMMKDVEKEIEVMKALRGNPWIVEYLGSEVRRTPGTAGRGSGWEVFILMEFCAGKVAQRCRPPRPMLTCFIASFRRRHH